VAGIGVPLVMRGIERKFRRERAELLASVSGRVLDVGCGDCPYLKVVAKASGQLVGAPKLGAGGVTSPAKDAVTQYVALEPNRHLHPAIRRSIAAVAPSFPVLVRSELLDEIELEEDESGYATQVRMLVLLMLVLCSCSCC